MVTNFQAAGFLRTVRPRGDDEKEERGLVLHATIANMTYVRRRGGDKGRGRTFDARPILRALGATPASDDEERGDEGSPPKSPEEPSTAAVDDPVSLALPSDPVSIPLNRCKYAQWAPNLFPAKRTSMDWALVIAWLESGRSGDIFRVGSFWSRSSGRSRVLVVS